MYKAEKLHSHGAIFCSNQYYLNQVGVFCRQGLYCGLVAVGKRRRVRKIRKVAGDSKGMNDTDACRLSVTFYTAQSFITRQDIDTKDTVMLKVERVGRLDLEKQLFIQAISNFDVFINAIVFLAFITKCFFSLNLNQSNFHRLNR